MISDIQPGSIWKHSALDYRSVVLSVTGGAVLYKRMTIGTTFSLSETEFIKAYSLVRKPLRQEATA